MQKFDMNNNLMMNFKNYKVLLISHTIGSINALMDIYQKNLKWKLKNPSQIDSEMNILQKFPFKFRMSNSSNNDL